MSHSAVWEEVLMTLWGEDVLRIGIVDLNDLQFIDGNRQYFAQLNPPFDSRKTIGLSFYDCIPYFSGSNAESLVLKVRDTNLPCSVSRLKYYYGPKRGLTEWSILFIPVTTRSGRRFIIDFSTEITTCQQLLNTGLLNFPYMTQRILQLMGLSPRQIDIIWACLQGKKNDQIAADLGISLHTVKRHLEMAYQRVGVHSFRELLVKISRHYPDTMKADIASELDDPATPDQAVTGRSIATPDRN